MNHYFIYKNIYSTSVKNKAEAVFCWRKMLDTGLGGEYFAIVSREQANIIFYKLSKLMKKKKAPEDVFETKCWEFKIIKDPYQVFANCFSFADISSFRQDIRQVLLFTTTSKIYNKEEPASLLTKFKAIISAILATNKINESKKSSALKLTFKEFTDKRLYARPYSTCPEWEYLPKMLTANEYQNPYIVFKKFFKYKAIKKWREDIGLVINYSLASYNEICDLNLLQLYFHLTKLMEASHLIDVREITHINGHLKLRLENT